MTTKSHCRLGIFLIRQNICQGSFGDCAAFLLGCVEPDLNPATYLKGSFHYERLRGHNYQNRRGYIEKMLRKISDAERQGILFHYRLGKLIHYLTDSFTYPHNAAFQGTMKDHVHYEKVLEQYFLQELKDCTFRPQRWSRKELCRKVSEGHDRYALEEAGITTDTRFTMEIILSVVMSLCTGYAAGFPILLYREVRHENSFNI